MLEGLLEAYGYSNRRAATESGVSPTSIARYIDGRIPNLTNATRLAGLFDDQDAGELLRDWGYDRAAEGLKARRTNDPNVANGWRLQVLIEETREVKTLLQRLVHLLEPKYPIPGEEDDSTD